jgi:hypothetical protein
VQSSAWTARARFDVDKPGKLLPMATFHVITNSKCYLPTNHFLDAKTSDMISANPSQLHEKNHDDDPSTEKVPGVISINETQS